MGQVDSRYLKIARRLVCEELAVVPGTGPEAIRRRLYAAMEREASKQQVKSGGPRDDPCGPPPVGNVFLAAGRAAGSFVPPPSLGRMVYSRCPNTIAGIFSSIYSSGYTRSKNSPMKVWGGIP